MFQDTVCMRGLLTPYMLAQRPCLMWPGTLYWASVSLTLAETKLQKKYMYICIIKHLTFINSSFKTCSVDLAN